MWGSSSRVWRRTASAAAGPSGTRRLTAAVPAYPLTGSQLTVAPPVVCTDQLQVYEEALDELRARGAVMYAVSTDATPAQTAFREKLGVSIPQLSDFEPKGETARKLGAYFEPGGMTNRAIVIFGPDGVVQWSHLADSPGDLPGANLIFDGLAA